MNGVPYWFIFWTGFVIIAFGGMLIGVRMDYQRRMKTLEILRMYAERGTDPPAVLAEHLSSHPQPHHHQPQTYGWKPPTGAAHHFGSFAFSLFMSGAAGGVAWWWKDADKTPEWVFYAAVIAASAFALGGLAHLIAAAMSGLSGVISSAIEEHKKTNSAPPPAP